MTKRPLVVGQLKTFLDELYMILSFDSKSGLVLRFDKRKRKRTRFTMPVDFITGDFFVTDPEEWK